MVSVLLIVELLRSAGSVCLSGVTSGSFFVLGLFDYLLPFDALFTVLVSGLVSGVVA